MRNPESTGGIFIRPSPLNKIDSEDREKFIEMLANRLKGRVLEAYVFGSFLTDSFDDQSDLDLILVVETERTFFRRIEDFFDITELGIGVDLLIYTPQEFLVLKASGEGAGFWNTVVSTMRKIV